MTYSRINLFVNIHSFLRTQYAKFTQSQCTHHIDFLMLIRTLVKHINKVHRGIRPFMCDVCGQAYGEESELRTHIARHNTIKQYHCSQCNYATHDKGNYQSKAASKSLL